MRWRLGRHRRPRTRSRRARLAAAGILTLGTGAIVGMAPAERVGTTASALQSSSSPSPFQAFSSDSWWNTPLPADAPQNPHESQILDYLRTAPGSGGGCLRLAGTGDSQWGHPIYWAEAGDPVYSVDGLRQELPELRTLRIPRTARPASNSDGSMSVFDVAKGYVVALTDARFHPDRDDWSAAGATVTYLDSNGVHAGSGRSDEARNRGSHRGNNGATMAVRWDMVWAGEIPHVLKISSAPTVSDRFVFPMVGSDGDYAGSDPAVPPQGLRMRIKPSVDVDSLELAPHARVIVTALQRYGVYIGDSGGTTALKLENTVAERRGQLWDLGPRDLCSLPFDPRYWDVVAEGYDPSSER